MASRTKESTQRAKKAIAAIGDVQAGLNELISCIDITDDSFDATSLVGEVQQAYQMAKRWKEAYQAFISNKTH